MADALTKKALNRLGVFTTFLGTAAGRTGFLGGAITEVGIPHARADSSPPAAYVADVPRWQALYDAWYTAADDAGLTVVSWASGPNWGDYNLAMHTNDSVYTATGTNIDKMMSPGGLDITEAHPVADGATYRRGVNVAGGEFGHKQAGFDNAHPGTFGTDYFFPTTGDVAALAARRITAIRLCVSWERLQPTLLGALDATYLGRITAVADACAANGVGLILDLHNYARYEYSDAGTKKVLVLRYETGLDLANPGPTGEDAGKLGRDHLIDVWRRLSNAYKAHAGVVAYELMNEPHDVAPSSGSFSGTTLNDWNTGTVQSWTGGVGATLAHTTSSPYEGSGALRVSGTTGTAGVFFNLRAERGSVAGTGNVLRGRVRMNGTPTGTWQARFEWQNSGFAWQAGTLSTLTPGVWTEVVCDFGSNPIAGTALNLCVQVQCNSPAGAAAVSFDLDLFERGALTGAFTDAQAWESITQAVLTDLRTRTDDATRRDTKTVLVPGHGWNVLGWSHAGAWLTEPSGLEGTHRYVTHHYFDSTATGGGEGEGVYQIADKRYADAQTYALAQGFADDADATAPIVSAVSAGGITDTGATIAWTTSEAADRRVEYGVTSALSPTVYGRSTARATGLLTSHGVTLTGLTPGTTYRYRVRSRDAAGNLGVGSSATGAFTTTGGGGGGPVTVYSAYTNTATATTPVATAYSPYSNTASATTPDFQSPLPAAPTNLVAVTTSPTRIDLTWTDNATGETGYAVERTTTGVTGFTQIASLPPNATGYADTGRSPGQTYTYRVRAFNASGGGPYSNTAAATTAAVLAAPVAPELLIVRSAEVGRVALQWADASGFELAFEVYRATAGSGGPYTLIGVNGPDTVTYDDVTVLPNTAYWYRVRATNGIGPSGYSNVVAALTPEVLVVPAINEAAGAVLLSVLVDWDNDGDFGDILEDVSGDVLLSAPMQSVRGRDQVRALAPPMAGSAQATLDNDARVYSPQNEAGPLYGLLLPGRRVRHTAERPGTNPAYSGVVLADGPIVYLRLGETSGTTAADASGNGRTGTYSGTYTLNQPGALRGDANPAVLFPGTTSQTRVTVAHTAALNLNAFTIECWVYLTSYGAFPARWRNLFQKNHPGGTLGVARNYGAWLQAGTNATLYFSTSTGGGTSLNDLPLTAPLALRRWYHLAFQHVAGSALRIFVDGEQLAQVADPNVPDTSTAPLYIGGSDTATYPALDYDSFPGRIDEFAVYDTALSSERIREHYRAGTAGLVPLFTGNLDDVPQQPAFDQKTATLPTLGSLARLRGVRVSTALYQNLRIDLALHALLDAAEWPAADRRILQGNTTLLWWWLDDRDAFEAATELLNTEGPGAYLGEDGEGNVVFEGRYHRLTNSRALLPQAVFAEDGMEPYRLDRLDYNPGLKGVINACSVETRLRAASGFEAVWSLGASFSLAPNEVRIFTAKATDGSPVVNAQTPQLNVDFTMVSGGFAGAALFRTSGGSITFSVQAGAGGGVFSGMQLRAQRVAVTNSSRVSERVDTTTSRGRYGRRNYTLDVWPEVDPLVAQDFCDAVVNAYQEPRATISVWIPAHIGGYTADRALALRPSDRIAVFDGQTGIAGEAFVEQVEYTNQGTEFLVRLGCEEASNAASNYLVWDLGSWDEDRWSY